MKQFTTSFSRSRLSESKHTIKIFVTNKFSKTILSSGNDNEFIFPRSSIKIFQAIPFVTSDAIKQYKLNSKVIALACSSHRGENYHIRELESWIKKIGISKKKLKCGIHNPLNSKSSEKLFRLNKFANELHNNCAGKHLAMLTTCLANNYNEKNYLDFNHPHQKSIRKIFEKFNNKKIKKNNYGIDGCSAPQYSFKIKDIAKMLTNLIKSYHNNFDFSKEVKILVDSVINNPKYIGGTDSLDSRIMTITNNKIFCKGGAEGVFLFTDLKKRIAGVIKIVDGNERALPSVIYNVFKKLKIMNYSELNKLKKFYNFKLFNHAKIIVGSIDTKI
tara:strand:- start:2456 stop:3448 length:993 start_codon:yes stop_codon:yes gene_type:complete